MNVNLNQETADALKKIASDSGISYTEAVRRAISVYKFVDDELDAGNRVQTVGPKGAGRGLVLM
ncbi:ribbon-helix-helix protein, CopG family [Modestobacter sp. SYSU DS0875]